MGLSHSTKGLPLGLTGAVSATRYVGATASVAPVAGTFAVGDFIVTSAGGIFVCTVAGTPGTWVAVGGGGGGISQISGSGAGAIFFGATDVEIDSPDSTTSLQVANGNVLLFGAGAPGALSGKGVQIAAGSDLIGIWISERTSAVLQMYADGAGTQDIELVDQTPGHWKSVNSGATVSKNLTDMVTLKKLAGLTTAVTQTSYAHGLGFTPSVVLVMPRGNVLAWESANADGTNIYLTGTGISTVDAYVGQ